MNTDEAIKVIRVLTTDARVFGLETDSLLRQGGNEMTAAALFRMLLPLDFSSATFEDELRSLIRDLCQGDPSVLIGLDDGRWANQRDADTEDDIQTSDSPSVHYLRLVHSSEDASFYLFHSGSRILDGGYVAGGARKREGAIHHIKVELSHPRFLQQILARARECPHLLRVEESSEDEFWAAPSHNPGY